MAPKVSILIPVYNIKDYLPRCLDSCINQTLQDIEIICVNDGSTDESLEILNSYSTTDKRIIVITKENGGLPSSRNVGMDHASGEYIMYLDGDDYIELNACEKLYNKAKKENATVIIYGGLVEPKEKRTDWSNSTLCPPAEIFAPLSVKDFLSRPYMFPFLWRNFISREHIEKNHFRLDESIIIGEDLAFQFKILPLAEKVISIPDMYYHYDCSRVGSLTNNKKYDNVGFRINSHLLLTGKLHEDWLDRKVLRNNERLFFGWAIDFVYWVFAQADTSEKPSLSQKIVSVFTSIGINEYLDQLSPNQNQEYEDILKWKDYKRNDGVKDITYVFNMGLEPRIDDFKNLVQTLLQYKEHICLEVYMHYYSPLNFIELEKYCLKYDFIRFNKTDEYTEYECFNKAINNSESKYIGFMKYDDIVRGDISRIISALKKNDNILITSEKSGADPISFVEIPLSQLIIKRSFLLENNIAFKKRGTLSVLSFKLDIFNATKEIKNIDSFIVSTLERPNYRNDVKAKTEYLDAMIDIVDYYKKTKNDAYSVLASSFLNDSGFVNMIIANPFGWNEEAAEFVKEIFEKIIYIQNSKCVYSSNAISKILIQFIRNRHTQMSGLKKHSYLN